MIQTNTPIDEALNLLTMDIYNSLCHGEQKELNKHYSIYKYYDMEYYTIKENDTNQEVIVVQTNGKNNFAFTEI